MYRSPQWREFLKKKKNEEPARPPLQPHDPVKRAGQAQGQASDTGRFAPVRLTGNVNCGFEQFTICTQRHKIVGRLYFKTAPRRKIRVMWTKKRFLFQVCRIIQAELTVAMTETSWEIKRPSVSFDDSGECQRGPSLMVVVGGRRARRFCRTPPSGAKHHQHSIRLPAPRNIWRPISVFDTTP